MKNNLLIFFPIISIIIQRIIYYFEDSQFLFPFLCGVPITQNTMVHNLHLLKWYLPIFFIINYFCGRLEEMLSGYGKLLIVRKYSKNKLLLKKILNLKIELFLFVLFQISVFFIFPTGFKAMFIGKAIVMLIMYFIFLEVIILVQFYCEFFIKPQVANIFINIFIILSIITTNTLYNTKLLECIRYFLISNFAMGFRNGLINIKIVHYSHAAIIFLSTEITLIILSIIKLRKIDLY